MTTTHILDFSLHLTASDSSLFGSPAQLGAFVYGELYIDASTPDSVPDDPGPIGLDVYEGAVTGGLLTFDMSGIGGGIDSEVFLGSSDFLVFNYAISTLQVGFHVSDSNIFVASGFDMPVNSIGLTLSGIADPGPLPAGSLAGILDAGADRYLAAGNNSSFIIAVNDGTGFPIASGGLMEINITAVPGPGTLAVAAVGALLLQRTRKHLPG